MISIEKYIGFGIGSQQRFAGDFLYGLLAGVLRRDEKAGKMFYLPAGI
jgi:hypothetical protein